MKTGIQKRGVHALLNIDNSDDLDIKGVVKERFIRLRISTFAEFKKRLETLFGKDAAATILFEAGRACGKRSALRVSSGSKKDVNSILEQIRKIKRDEKWCKVDFNRFDIERGAGVVIMKDSFEGLGYSNPGEPVCHFLRGYFSGVLSYLCKADIVLIEVKCIAKGDPYCELRDFLSSRFPLT
ncbi:MAG: V4R domain-containing protein [Candidatus Bathyarchaeia archaeon]